MSGEESGTSQDDDPRENLSGVPSYPASLKAAIAETKRELFGSGWPGDTKGAEENR